MDTQTVKKLLAAYPYISHDELSSPQRKILLALATKCQCNYHRGDTQTNCVKQFVHESPDEITTIIDTLTREGWVKVRHHALVINKRKLENLMEERAVKSMVELAVPMQLCEVYGQLAAQT